MHRELSEVNCAPAKPQEVSPFLDSAYILGISKDLFQIRIAHAHTSEAASNVWRRQQLYSVKNNVVSRHLDSGNTLRLGMRLRGKISGMQIVLALRGDFGKRLSPLPSTLTTLVLEHKFTCN